MRPVWKKYLRVGIDMTEFKLEERYIVVKKKRLNGEQISAIEAVVDALGETVECVVIEEHWPEYDAVVKMLSDRIEGRQAVSSALQTVVLGDGHRLVSDVHCVEEDWAGIYISDSPHFIPVGEVFVTGAKVDSDLNASFRIVSKNPASFDVIIAAAQRAKASLVGQDVTDTDTKHRARLEWLASRSAVIEPMTVYSTRGDIPLWYVLEREPNPDVKAPYSAAMNGCRIFGESETSIEAAIDTAMERELQGKSPYYA
jgi:hypothetical protein